MSNLDDFERWISRPAWAKDAVVNDLTIRLSWRDRLLVLLGRPFHVTVKTWTSEPVGRTEGMTRSTVLGFRWPWKRKRFAVAEAPSGEP
jgi:hypothetical protein